MLIKKREKECYFRNHGRLIYIKWIFVVNVGVHCCVIWQIFFITSNVFQVCKLIIRILVIAICIKYNIQVKKFVKLLNLTIPIIV